jgi:excisionase family DNA binding protein
MLAKGDNRAIREVNRSIVVDLVRRGGRISRTELARRSKLTKPTVSTIIFELIDEGVVREVRFGESVSHEGRRPGGRAADHAPSGSADHDRGLRAPGPRATSRRTALHGGRLFLLSVGAVAERLGVCAATVYRLCDRGELPHVRIVNSIRIRPEDLRAFLDRSTGRP